MEGKARESKMEEQKIFLYDHPSGDKEVGGVGIESFATIRYANLTSLMPGNTTMLLSLWMHIAEQSRIRIHIAIQEGIHIGST